MRRLHTRLYFEDEPANQAEPILALVPDDRRATPIASRMSGESGLPLYRLDVRLQGEGETVFFEA